MYFVYSFIIYDKIKEAIEKFAYFYKYLAEYYHYGDINEGIYNRSDGRFHMDF